MGRKSLAVERREEILAAFERCIGQHGIDVPLEVIADAAGVQRSLIRHYLGNRDELVDQVIARIAEAYPTQVAELIAPAQSGGVNLLLDALFAGQENPSDWDNVLAAVINTAHGRYPQAKQRIAQMLRAIVQQVADVLAHLHPGADQTVCYETAYGLLCLLYSHESLIWIGLDPHHTTLARTAAKRLIAQLER